jgi:hypothetical protein
VARVVAEAPRNPLGTQKLVVAIPEKDHATWVMATVMSSTLISVRTYFLHHLLEDLIKTWKVYTNIFFFVFQFEFIHENLSFYEKVFCEEEQVKNINVLYNLNLEFSA